MLTPMHSRRMLLALLAILVALPAHAAPRAPLVLAAASLQESMNAAADAWARMGHARPVLSFAASSALARQIQSGAPADLFVSADEPWMDAVEKAGKLVPGSRAAFLGNRLVLAAAAGDRRNVPLDRAGPLLAAIGPARLAMADPEAVPAGLYGKAALQKIGAWSRLAPRVVRAENVRAALALVERGATPFGIVYATDARASAKVRIAGMFPAATHPPIRYPVARLKTGASPEGEPFRRFLTGARGKAIFARYGFTPL